MYTFTGNNPTELYRLALDSLIKEGDTCAPRGKKIKELRPVCFEFTNPLSRTTFLYGRSYNPFFQLAEALWILQGRADVDWLTQYNKNMASFSDDGKWFNAPYGERIKYWNKSSLRGFTIPGCINQYEDAYMKLKEDKDTRRAVSVIYNPAYDTYDYIHNGGLDQPCNLILTWKIRKDNLDLTVFNRSNDIHWGVFGANIVQFSTIQEMMANWLGIKAGTYRQITDSLHVYTEDYGASQTEKIVSDERNDAVTCLDFYTDTEPRMTGGKNLWDKEFRRFWEDVDPYITPDNSEHDKTIYDQVDDSNIRDKFDDIWSKINSLGVPYLKMSAQLMFIYQLYKRKFYNKVAEYLWDVEYGQWKVACMKMIHKKVCENKYDRTAFKAVLKTMPEIAQKFIMSN